LDVVSKAIERMANEILVKQDRNAWAVALKGLADGRGKFGTDAVPTGLVSGNIVNTSGTAAAAVTLADLNKLITKMKRLNASYAVGSPVAAYSKGITDLFVSPEVVANFRAMSFTAFEDSAAAEQVGSGVKDEMYRAGGFSSLFGINIVDMYEFGVGQKYQTLFNAVKNSNTTFDTALDNLLVGVDRSVDAFVRPVARNAETGSTFTALPDDQYSQRQDKIGFYGGLEEGRVMLDARAIVGLIKAIPA
jgi:hypothetical protein